MWGTGVNTEVIGQGRGAHPTLVPTDRPIPVPAGPHKQARSRGREGTDPQHRVGKSRAQSLQPTPCTHPQLWLWPL